MQFLKKNYEKVLLGLVLVGLVVVAVFLLLVVANEKQAQEERRTKIINRPVKPLVPVVMAPTDALLKRAATPMVLNFSDNSHRLFNPVRWQKTADGRLIRNPVGTDLQRMEILEIDPLYFSISLESITASETSVRYGFVIEDQAAEKPSFRGRRPYYLSKGEKKEYGEDKKSFVLKEVMGAPEAPSAVILDLSDQEKPVSISKDKPYRRVDGYMADLKFAPENRTYSNRRVGDRIAIAGEEYNIVAITENEVVLSAKSNQKKWTIKYSPTP
ncbi:MAG TPA: hypothetical protein VFW05_04305 [Verrucomicrobiae bacterium]|jgi:hypothetical protein|nr:hypothetical protein [Verrucomicrobiae bacterium]